MTKPLEIAKGTKYKLFVESDDKDTDYDEVDVMVNAQKGVDQVPGSELTSSTQDLVDSMLMLKENIGVIATQTKEALKEHQPDEWSVKLQVGFKGKLAFP